ncbi:MAG TPA: 4-hydroxybenzoate octaprenyltransferase [Planctomycetes bacterium]|nr:4-hydroxybenzoate octaprenyltransferase [Planctomycetota bacterium]
MIRSSDSPPGLMGSFIEFGEMIKISHTLFAMPFAIGAGFLAASETTREIPHLVIAFLQIILAVAFARTAAMSFNRWADKDIDGKNPRTSERSIPAGRLSSGKVLTATIVSALGFIGICAWISPIALLLSPIVLLVVLGYSYTKRVTWLCHAVLGTGLGLAPVGAWLVVTGDLSHPIPWLLGTAVLFWTTGFDIIYACQDAEVDQAQSLNSIPACFGVGKALLISKLCHVMMVILLGGLCFVMGFPLSMVIATLITIVLLIIEHLIISKGNLEKIEISFFQINIAISLMFLIAMIFEVS